MENAQYIDKEYLNEARYFVSNLNTVWEMTKDINDLCSQTAKGSINRERKMIYPGSFDSAEVLIKTKGKKLIMYSKDNCFGDNTRRRRLVLGLSRK